jgi:hypothetical protein
VDETGAQLQSKREREREAPARSDWVTRPVCLCGEGVVWMWRLARSCCPSTRNATPLSWSEAACVRVGRGCVNAWAGALLQSTSATPLRLEWSGLCIAYVERGCVDVWRNLARSCCRTQAQRKHYS